MNLNCPNPDYSLNNVFNRFGWHLTVNTSTHIHYTQHTNETSYFAMTFIPKTNTYVVSFPLLNSTYQYTTAFHNHYDACIYLEQRLYELNNIKCDNKCDTKKYDNDDNKTYKKYEQVESLDKNNV